MSDAHRPVDGRCLGNSKTAAMPESTRFSMAALLALARFLATTGDIEALERVTAEIYERWSSETALDN
jgi:hypothetical protein